MPEPRFKIQARLLGGKILDWNDYEMPSSLRWCTWDSEAEALSEMERLAPLSGWPMVDLRVVPADA
jgi:hypothetical protein